MEKLYPKRIFTFLVALVLTLPVIGQLPNHLNGELALEIVSEAELESDASAGQLEMFRVEGFAQEEIVGDDVFSDEWGLTVAGRGSYTKFDFDTIAPGELNVFGLELPIALVSDQLNNFAFDFEVAPGIYSDLDDFDGDHVQVHGKAAVDYIYRPEIRVLLGAKYDQAFGEEELYPYLGLKFRSKSKKLEFDLVFPEPRLAYNPSDAAQLYLFGKALGGSWNASESVGLGGKSDLEVEYSALQAGGGIVFEVGYDMWIYINGGMEFEREYNVNVESGSEVVETDLEDAWFARVGFILK